MSESREQRLESILHAYLQAVDRGEKPDRAALLEAHPEWREELAEYFADESRLERLLQTLRTSALPGEGTSPLPIRVRYVGDYELLEEIARGGMGVVFKAKQVSLNRVVALKMILKGELAAESDRRRFRQEAEAAANLDHPNIVPIYEVGEHQGQQYFSMKLIERGERKKGHRAVAETVAKVARAVHHAHQRGILHRDLKPGNILVDTNGEPHVADFGLAKKVDGGDDATRSGALVGTPAYMSPEQARAEKSLTTGVDVWSMGAILYDWLTGQPPFRGNDVVSTLMKVSTEEPLSPRSLDPTIERDLETICLKCLRKEPEQRYPSASALADDLDRWLRGDPIEARSAGTLERAWRWCKRNRAVAALLVATGLSLILGTLISAYFAIQAHHNAELHRAEAIISRNHEERAREEEKKAWYNAELAQLEKGRAEKQLTLAESRLYADNLAHAQRAFQDGDGHVALKYLEDCQWNLRGMEHRLLWNRFSSLATLYRHPVGVTNVQFSPNGKHLISSGGKLVIIWDVSSGREVAAFEGENPSCSREGQVLFQRMTDFHSDSTLHLWDAKNGMIVLPFQVFSRLMQISPDGRFILAGYIPQAPNAINILDIKTGKVVQHFKGHPWMKTGGYAIHHQIFSPDGKWVASAAADESIKVWDVGTGAELYAFKTGTKTSRIAFNPTGKKLAGLVNKYDVAIWEVESGKVLHTFKGQPSLVGSFEFSPDGKRLVSGGKTIRVWDVDKGVLLASINNAASSVGFSPDGKRLVSNSGDAVRLWDAEKGQGIDTRKLGAGALRSVALSPDGKRVVTGNLDRSLSLWEVATGRFLFAMKGHGQFVTALCFSPDGKRIVSGTSGLIQNAHGKRKVDPAELKVWDAENGTEIRALVGHEDTIIGVAFNPLDGKLISIGRDGDMRFWEGATGKPLARFNTLDGDDRPTGSGKRIGGRWEFAQGQQPGVAGFGLSSDGRLFATGNLSGTVTVYDAASGRKLQSLEADGMMTAQTLVFSRDSKRLTCAGNERAFNRWQDLVKIWDLENGKAITLTGRPAEISGMIRVLFSKDDQRVLVFNTQHPHFTVFDSRTGVELMVHKSDSGLFAWGEWANTQEGERLLTMSFPTEPQQTIPVELNHLNLNQAQQLYSFPEGQDPISGLAFRSDGKRLVSVSSEPDRQVNPDPLKGNITRKGTHHGVKVWDTEKGRELLSWKAHDAWITSVAFRPDGKRFLTTSEDRTIKSWDAEKGQLVATFKADGPVTCAVYSPDGNRIVSGGKENSATVWDATRGERLFTLQGHRAAITGIAFDPQGATIATSSEDRTGILWDAANGEQRLALKGHDDTITGIAFSPDGKWIATSSADRTARIWDAANGTERIRLNGHTDRVNSVAFSEDGRMLVTASKDRSLRVWDAQTGKARDVHRYHGDEVTQALFQPDSHRIASGSWDRTVKLWISSITR